MFDSGCKNNYSYHITSIWLKKKTQRANIQLRGLCLPVVVGLPGTPPTSHHYDEKEFKGVPQFSPIMPRVPFFQRADTTFSNQANIQHLIECSDTSSMNSNGMLLAATRFGRDGACINHQISFDEISFLISIQRKTLNMISSAFRESRNVYLAHTINTQTIIKT